jgi:hypothetical protein
VNVFGATVGEHHGGGAHDTVGVRWGVEEAGAGGCAGERVGEDVEIGFGTLGDELSKAIFGDEVRIVLLAERGAALNHFDFRNAEEA